MTPYISIKIKILAIVLSIQVISLGVLFHFSYQIFVEDKRAIVSELNNSILQTAVSEIQLELKNRMEWSLSVVPRAFHFEKDTSKPQSVFEGVPEIFSKDLLVVSFYRKTENGKLEKVKQFVNEPLEMKRSILGRTANELDTFYPLSPESFSGNTFPLVLNRSFKISSENLTIEVPIVTLLVPGTQFSNELSGLWVTLDLIQDFIRHRLHGPDLANLFLINKKGNLISHPSLSSTIEYAKTKFPHPIVQRLSLKHMPKENFELETSNDTLLINLRESGIADHFVVSQISHKDAFRSSRRLIDKGILIGIGGLFLAALFSILLGRHITLRILKVRDLVEQIGIGNFSVKNKLNSNDEIQSLASTVQWTSERLASLMKEAVLRAKTEEQLLTGKFFQRTFPHSQELHERVEFQGFNLPVPVFSGDFWDVFSSATVQTFIMGDAVGAGTAAAMSSVAVKSCLATFRTKWTKAPLAPEEVLNDLNKVLWKLSQGKLLFSLCVANLHLETGELVVANAGGEVPLCLRSQIRMTRRTGSNIEPLPAWGERLGFADTTVYHSERYQLQSGDALVFYTHGLISAKNLAGATWGERGLTKSFSQQISRPLAAAAEGLSTAIQHHVQGIQQKHDLTFLMANWKKPLVPVDTEVSKPIAKFPAQGERSVLLINSNPNASQLSRSLKEESNLSDLDLSMSSVMLGKGGRT